MSINFISADGFADKLAQAEAPFVIDVRTEAEFAECHVAGAKLYPLQDFNIQGVLEDAGESDQIFVLCKAGGRAKQAAEKLAKVARQSVFVVSGGTDACVNIDVPHVVGKASMSLERQVRIAAGTLVVLGVVTGAMLHPGFFGVAAFVGAGLVFAGVTDTCAMGMILARMPWNKSRGGELQEAST